MTFAPGHPYRWQPGKSANPGGVPKDDIGTLARKLTNVALRALVLDLAVPERRQGAAREILDRGWGKPAQAIMAQVNTQLTVSGIDKPPDITETYEEWLTRRRAELDELERAAIVLESTVNGERPAVKSESAVREERRELKFR
jgi:hypothetical protein